MQRNIFASFLSGIVLATMIVFSTLAHATAPVILSLSPGSGTSGTAVTITGTGFGATQGTSSVKFGDMGGGVTAVVATITFWSDTSIQTVVPTFTTGESYFQVVVGQSSNKAAFALTNPLITALTPSTGSVGSSVTISGVNLGSSQGSSVVTIGGITASITTWSVDSLGGNSIVATVPSGLTNGNKSVQITVGGIATNTQTYIVSTHPFISFLSDNSALIDEDITVNGVNFGASQGSSTITFNGMSATPSFWSDTAITVAVPAGVTTGNVVVTVGGTASNGMEFVANPVPQMGGVGFVQGNYSNKVECVQGPGGILTSTMEIPFTLEQTAGNLNVVNIAWRDTRSADLVAVGDDVSDSWLALWEQTQSSNGRQKAFFANNIVGGVNAILVTWTSTNGCVATPEVSIAEYRGVSTDSAFVDTVVAAASTSSTACNSGSATTTNSNDLLIGVNLAAKTTAAPGTGYSNRLITTPGGDILEDQIVTAAGSYSATATMSASGNCVMEMFAFKEAPNSAPDVSAGPNQTITLPTNSVTLEGTATDDGLPNNTLTIGWTKLSGPGTVTFGSPSAAVTQATFSASGTYVLQLNANDSQLSTNSAVTITVNPAVVPPTVSAGPNQTITLPANIVTLNGSATDGGLPLTTSWSIVSGPASVLFANGSNPVTTAMFTVAGVYDLRLTASNGQNSASADATITVNPQTGTPAGGSIVLSPTSAGPILTGTSQQLQATVTNNTGGAIASASVKFTVSGPNATTGTVTANSSGIATFSYTGTHAGIDAVVATSTIGTLSLTSNTSMISWVVQSPGITASTVVGEFFTSDGSGTFDTASTATPIFTQTFTGTFVNFNPPTGSVPGMPTNIGVTTPSFTDVLTDGSGNYTSSQIATGGGTDPATGSTYVAGLGSLSTFQAVFTGTLTVAAAGNVTFNFLNSDGFVFGVGNSASRVSGMYVDPPANTTFHSYPVMGSFNTVTAPVQNTITVHFPAAGSYPYEIDYTDSNQAALISSGSTWKYKVANATLGTINSISRASNVVTVTVNQALSNFAAGATVAIAGVTDATNFPNSTQTVASVTSIVQGSGSTQPSTTFTLSWSGTNASSSSGTVSEQFNQPFYLVGFDDSGFSLG